MNANEFQTMAIAWIGTIGTIAAVAVPMYFKIKAQIDENKKRLDKHDEIQQVDTKTETPK